MEDDPKKIWLAPECYSGDWEGRNWCEDNVWDEECECEGKPHKAVLYIRADLIPK